MVLTTKGKVTIALIIIAIIAFVALVVCFTTGVFDGASNEPTASTLVSSIAIIQSIALLV